MGKRDHSNPCDDRRAGAGRGAFQAGRAGAGEPDERRDRLPRPAGLQGRVQNGGLLCACFRVERPGCRHSHAVQQRGEPLEGGERRGEATQGQLAFGDPGHRHLRHGLLDGAEYQEPTGCAHVVFCSGVAGHRRHLYAPDRGQRMAVPQAAGQQAVLLSGRPLRVGLLHDLPHEAQRRGSGVHLRHRHDGAGDVVHHHLPDGGHRGHHTGSRAPGDQPSSMAE